MRGVPLTPEQIKIAAATYAKTGNYTTAAKAIGADRSAVRRALIARGEPDRTTLHRHAAQRAERFGRACVERNMRRIEAQLVEHVDAPLAGGRPPGLEPADQERLYREQRLALAQAVSINDSLSKRKTDRLHRKRLSAEVDEIHGKTPGRKLQHGVSVDVTDTKALHARLATLVAEAGEEAGAEPVKVEPGEAG